MLETLKENPWRTAALGLALLLIIATGFILFSGGGDSGDESAVDTTTSNVSGDGGESPVTTGSTESTAAGGEAGSSAGTSGGGFIAVKVDNAPAARPLVGLNAAPLLVEHLVEGGITRFTAVFPQSATGQVGPIRSVRPVDPDLLPQLAPVVVTSGGRPWILGEIEGSGTELIDFGLPSFFVSGSNPDPHNWYLVIDWLYEFISPEDFTVVSGLPTGELPGPSGTANTIELPYGDIAFEYEPAFGYGRSQEGTSFQVQDEIDGPTTQLTHETIVIMFAAERPAGYEDVNGIPVSTFDVIGSGRILVFSGGEVIEGVWQRAALADGFVFVDDSGLPFGLPEGRVYMAVVPRDLDVEYR